MTLPTFSHRRPQILVLLGAFWPGHDATGPNQSFRALAMALSNQFDFKVVARDRPFGSSHALATSGVWADRDFAKVRYCSVSALRGARGLCEILRTTPYDALMMNGFFDREFTIPALVLQRLGRVPRRPTILSTRGEFAPGALELKNRRKRAYLAVARRLGLHRDVLLHATGVREAQDIRDTYPHTRGVIVAPNMRRLGGVPPTRDPGAPTDMLRLAFLGRITPVKNVDYALEVLSKVSCPVVFDIYGPVQEAGYWQKCRELVARLPTNISVVCKGEIAHNAVPDVLAGYDLFFMPTRGENFGHAVFDALAAGLPALVSDQTPFQDLERHEAGWSLPLAEPRAFVTAIEKFAGMLPSERARLRHGARRLAETKLQADDAIQRNCEMLRALLGCGDPEPG